MNINFEDYLVPIIVIGCLCIGYVLKRWMPADDKWIPTILLILGALSGLILFGVNYEGIVKGMLSGLASVGLHQAFYQFIKAKRENEATTEVFNQDLLKDMLGFDEDLNLLGELEGGNDEDEIEERESEED